MQFAGAGAAAMNLLEVRAGRLPAGCAALFAVDQYPGSALAFELERLGMNPPSCLAQLHTLGVILDAAHFGSVVDGLVGLLDAGVLPSLTQLLVLAPCAPWGPRFSTVSELWGNKLVELVQAVQRQQQGQGQVQLLLDRLLGTPVLAWLQSLKQSLPDPDALQLQPKGQEMAWGMGL